MRSSRAVAGARVTPTLRQAGPKPDCPKCGHSEHVIRVWFGDKKQWACSVHFKITSTRRKDASLKQRVLHKLPEADTFTIPEVFPNRAARRRRR